MKISFFVILLLCFLDLEAQNRKVDMFQELPLQEALIRAAKAKKYVLLDFGSPRCSPCLYIKKKVFTIDSVADFINANFISVDYMQGDEKKRLSKIYGVYSEPVILITDIKGNLMHRMEGKCEAPEMLARLRQGLNDDLNLKALQQKYQDGERDIRFLEYFLETLHIAGLREQKAEVLKDIFTKDFDLTLLKEPSYWNIFYRYNESPTTQEAIYVFEHRQVFYELFGETTVNNKLNQMFAGRVRMYTYGTVPPIESEEFRQMLLMLQHCDYEESTMWLIYLVPAQYKFKNWIEMAQCIQRVLDFNIVKGKEREMYMIMMSRQICWYSDCIEALKMADSWMDKVIKGANINEQEKLKKEQSQIKEKIKEISASN
ncbi:MAG: thioredoxin family protein [Marinifilaceae bacterium]|nr:thioredoxin family protein [Marinifilaceae bacterium]